MKTLFLTTEILIYLMELKSKLIIYSTLLKYEASYLFSFLYLICRNLSLFSVWLKKAPK